MAPVALIDSTGTSSKVPPVDDSVQLRRRDCQRPLHSACGWLHGVRVCGGGCVCVGAWMWVRECGRGVGGRVGGAHAVALVDAPECNSGALQGVTTAFGGAFPRVWRSSSVVLPTER